MILFSFAESLEKDMVVFDVDNNPLANTICIRW
jgi:hypothetical protein